MLSNLLDNALKYTPPDGKVGLELTCNEKEVTIIIRDTGIGIEDKNQQHIYDRFFRCDASRTTSGNGLGLSFVKAVVFAHGGKIDLVSVSGKGSVFTIILPI
jgi:two-component system phosphate regulon sensor histidine kinase PhoR